MSHFESAKTNFLSRIRKVNSGLASHKNRMVDNSACFRWTLGREWGPWESVGASALHRVGDLLEGRSLRKCGKQSKGN